MLGYDASLYGEHSGKRGGGSTVATNGATDQQLKRLGVGVLMPCPPTMSIRPLANHLSRSFFIRRPLSACADLLAVDG